MPATVTRSFFWISRRLMVFAGHERYAWGGQRRDSVGQYCVRPRYRADSLAVRDHFDFCDLDTERPLHVLDVAQHGVPYLGPGLVTSNTIRCWARSCARAATSNAATATAITAVTKRTCRTMPPIIIVPLCVPPTIRSPHTTSMFRRRIGLTIPCARTYC